MHVRLFHGRGQGRRRACYTGSVHGLAGVEGKAVVVTDGDGGCLTVDGGHHLSKGLEEFR